MEYLPVTPGELRKYAVYDKKKGVYAWERLGCSNYDLTYFGISIPEVTKIRENKDGTITLTVEAVCEMVVGDGAAVTHELTVCIHENGGFRYWGNKILGDGMNIIPANYRVKALMVDDDFNACDAIRMLLKLCFAPNSQSA